MADSAWRFGGGVGLGGLVVEVGQRCVLGFEIGNLGRQIGDLRLQFGGALGSRISLGFGGFVIGLAHAGGCIQSFFLGARLV